ncbi:MAG TPA: glutamate--cysteine ligase [Steroidobacteraceae bacterium]|nr:glutamate--cysteine ligase [Steroidobacteraceae bacterium]
MEFWVMARASVDRVYERRIAALINSREQRLLSGGLRGIERESLRVTPDGRLAQTGHPRALGSALTHPHITTDYSESLIELVTPAFADNATLMSYLNDLHRFVYAHLGEELLWAPSMPCELASDSEIPIARYGSSHSGRIKSIYRHGLLIRYGGMMQAISGVHFNYSLPPGFWPLYAELCEARQAGQGFISDRYFDLLRNYRRYGWLVSYLFGASPALCRSFLQGAQDGQLRALGSHTLVGPEATSLRMSDLGYRNRNQSAVTASVNSLAEYVRDLRHAVHQPHPPYLALGVKVGEDYRQLSGNLLQIENEYYSYIRPKRTLQAGERTVHALARAGVEYVEVRALDNSAFDPVGVNPRKLHFLEAFLQMLLLKDSPPIDALEEERIDRNHLRVARQGRAHQLMLERDGRDIGLADWAAALLDEMLPVCEWLDAGHGGGAYMHALRDQLGKLQEPERTPSARLLAELTQHDESFAALALRFSIEHRAQLAVSGAEQPERLRELDAMGEESLRALSRLEARQRSGFDEYLAAYLAD